MARRLLCPCPCIGPQRYGPAKRGALVRVTAAGVEIDGESRGPLPAVK